MSSSPTYPVITDGTVRICPACDGQLSVHRDGSPDDLVSCRCTIVSIEWLNLAAAIASSQQPASTAVGEDANRTITLAVVALRSEGHLTLAAELEALATQPPLIEEGWHPIETAPRDGTQIIIGWAKHGQVRGISRAKWVSAEFWADKEGGDPEDFEAGWYEPNYEDELCANVWMPLPPLNDAVVAKIEGRS